MASFSSGEAPPPKVNEGLKFMLCPQEGDVFLDCLASGEQVLTHVRTLRRQRLPASGRPWALVFDGDKFGALLGIHDEVVCLENYLTRMLYEGANGQLFIVDRDASGKLLMDAPWSLSDKMREFKTEQVRLQHMGAQVSFSVFSLVWPRGGCHLLWQPFVLYPALGMTSHGGKPSKWVYESLPRWERMLAALGCMGYLFKSNASTSAVEALGSHDKFLPFLGITTFALLFLLLRWAFSSTRQGGLRETPARERAMALVTSLIEAIAIESWTFDVDFDRQWRIAWPRPQLECARKFTLHVSEGGYADVPAWAAEYNQEIERGGDIAGVKFGWFKAFKDSVTDDGRISLADMVKAAGVATRKEHDGLFLQLLWHTCLRIEAIVNRTADQDLPQAKIFMEKAPMEELCQPREVDRTCAKHREASKIACHGMQSIGIAVDKVNARSIDLQNSFCVLPNNIAFELVPQVGSSRV